MKHNMGKIRRMLCWKGPSIRILDSSEAQDLDASLSLLAGNNSEPTRGTRLGKWILRKPTWDT